MRDGAIRLRNGHLRVPCGGHDEKTGIFWDGIKDIGPEDPEYQKWLDWHKRMDVPLLTEEQAAEERKAQEERWRNPWGRKRQNSPET